MQKTGVTSDVTHREPWAGRPAAQQPEWRDHAFHHEACRTLEEAGPLVPAEEVRQLRWSLADLPATGGLLLQLGDCAESLYECTPRHTAQKLQLIDRLGSRFGELTGRRVVCVGRMGGQFAKPRSRSTESHGTLVLPSFRGHMINSELTVPQARQPDPRRMVWAHDAGALVQRAMRKHRRRDERPPAVEGPWSSHEALVLDYEARLIRTEPETDEPYLSSTHLPWVGERTRDPDGAHVALLSAVANPVGCKIGPTADVDEVLRVCEVLDPRREPGRLVLIPRMGHLRIRNTLPPVVRAVANAGHPVVWLSDPMHGNTVKSGLGLKTRHLADVIDEALRFRDIVEGLGQHAAGLHVEVAADDVTECVGGSVENEDGLQRHYTTLCDPRLNAGQAVELLEAWAKGTAPSGS